MPNQLPPSSYLNYLPALYRRSDVSGEFIGQYLNIFEKMLSGLDSSGMAQPTDENAQLLLAKNGLAQLLDPAVIADLFYPRLSFLYPNNTAEFMPELSGLPAEQQQALLAILNQYVGFGNLDNPLLTQLATNQAQVTISWDTRLQQWLNELLNWLGSWVGLVVDDNWSIDKKRLVVASIMPLYRTRGTPAGMQQLLNLLFDLPKLYTWYVNGQELSGYLQINVQDGTNAIPLVVSDSVDSAFVLQDNYDSTAPVVDGYKPGLFILQVILPNVGGMGQQPVGSLSQDIVQAIVNMLVQVRLLVEQYKPELSRAQLQVYPSIRLATPGNENGINHQLDYNTLLG